MVSTERFWFLWKDDGFEGKIMAFYEKILVSKEE
jgi:hypothetical protein